MMTAEIKKMTIPERLRTMEAIWDSLLYEGADVSSPEWHRSILAERRRKIDEGTASFLSIDEVKQRRK